MLRRSGKAEVARGCGASLQCKQDCGLHRRWLIVSGAAISRYLEFDVLVAVRAALEALEHKSKSIELAVSATVFVPPAPRNSSSAGSRPIETRGPEKASPSSLHLLVARTALWRSIAKALGAD